MFRRCLLAAFVSASASAQQVAEGPEPNESVATATVLACGAQAAGQIASAVDADWYKLILGSTTDLRLETGPGVGVQIGDTTLTLLDAVGAPLQNNDNGTGVGYYSRLYAIALPAGTYYVSVERGPLGAASGSYVLDVRCAVPVVLPAPAIVAEGAENNDSRTGGTPTTIVPSARGNGVITTTGAGGDWDFYRFTLLLDSFVRVRVNGTAMHPTPPVMDDPILYLYDAATPPNLLAGPFYASNYGVWDTAIDVRLTAGIYQVAIRGWVGSIAGRYYLDVLRTDAARNTVHAGGCGGRVLDLPATNVGPNAPLRLERTVIGTTYTLQGSGLGSNGIVLHVVGFLPTFIDLTPFGAPGCTLQVVWVDTPLQFADAAGNATIVVPVPETPTLLGATLESQLAVLDLSNALGFTLSNSVSAVVGN